MPVSCRRREHRLRCRLAPEAGAADVRDYRTERGHLASFVWLASPATVAASAIAGCLVSFEELLPSQ